MTISLHQDTPPPPALTPVPAASALGQEKAAAGGKSRSRLFIKYVALFVAVVGVALLSNGIFEVIFYYREHRAALIRIQHEQAVAAAAKIGQFIKEIESQLGWTTQLPWSAGSIEQRRFDALRLLRQVPAITELAQLDSNGKERLRVSRLAMNVIDSGLDFSKDPKFTEAMANKVYYGPVYFRRESEPYMTLAVTGTRKEAGVSIAEVNLKLIWDVVSQIKVGKHGRAYVVDSKGRLIAHPDISLVLRNTDMSRLPQVQAAQANGGLSDDIKGALNIQGQEVLTASAPIAPLRWTMFVELPVQEAYASLYAALQRLVIVLLAASIFAVLAGIFLARRMVGPIQALRAGAERIGGGDFSQRISIKTGDELERLADQFNDMGARLQESYADLEAKVEGRTKELARRQSELRVTFDNMGDGVVMFDGELRLVSWNRNLQQILDIPDTFFATSRTYQDYIAHLVQSGDFGDVDLNTELRNFTANAERQSTIERTRPDGRVLEVRHNPVPAGGFVLIYRDITERKRAEEEIRAARDAAEKALADLRTAQDRLIQTEKLASLGQLTAGIAHEIKNPLNFVNNFSSVSNELIDELTDMLKSAAIDNGTRREIDELTQMLKANLEKVVQHGKRADSIVKNMLLHSREGSGEHRPADINAIVEESLNLAYHGARAERPGFNITLKRDLDPSAGLVDIFPQEITRVLLNLISNGFYAATKRKQGEADGFEPTLSASTKTLGDKVAIRIRDNGTGIPKEVREKIFNPFFTTKPAGEGTGLGLSMSHDIVVKQHGGKIEVATEPGVFTEFIITLPRKLAAQSDTTGGRS
ncbi:ATPase [Bradyrhizobium macuxiense]|uniref:histidine kinase n=1 Tax=Bradyrhizobium macuxiense TaxID=1755647 RepID=A0A120FKW8_9BRAD|nr:HAMP domain-containing histidine kinase [Bradyrhizobium macuxiense]KWV51366.1 ATPase [Bradyrhizobium macuxiense]